MKKTINITPFIYLIVLFRVMPCVLQMIGVTALQKKDI